MFSSKELISFVFANENDTYYGEDLLKLDLNQYLWEQLHESYDAVYFLSAGDKSFQVRSFGDLCCEKYTPKKFKLFGGTPQQEQGKWLLDQLKAKPGRTAAFVCPLEDFCSILSDSRWDEVLEDIVSEKKRSGIFVLTASATAEQTSALLLESPVFEKLRETSVTDLRGGALRELYGTLQRRKADSCLFLNAFSWERVHGLLLHLALEHPDRIESAAQLDRMTDYLYAWLLDPDAAGGEPLSWELPPCYLSYEKIYEQLRNDHIWAKLAEQSTVYAHSEHRERTRERSGIDVPVLRDITTYAGRCLKLRLPRWMQEEEDVREYAQILLKNIRSAVQNPKNRVENRQIASAAEGILDQMHTVRKGDTNTLLQILKALKFCVNYIYTAENEPIAQDVTELIEMHNSVIFESGQCFLLRWNLEHTKTYSQGKYADTFLAHDEEQLKNKERLLKENTDAISVRELRLSSPDLSGDLQTLEKNIRRLEEPVPEPIAEPVPEEHREPEIREEEEPKLIDEDELDWANIYDSHAPNFS